MVSTTQTRPLRTDWFAWDLPDALWCRTYATFPGLKFAGIDGQTTRVTFHRSHTPILPSYVVAGLQARTQLSAGAQQTDILRPYQVADLPFLLSREGSLVAWDMRLGKTAFTCHGHDPRDGSLVVVGPLASRDVWVQWIERVHGFKPFLLKGTKHVATTAIPQQAPAYFVHFDVLDEWTHFLCQPTQKIATLVFDECHVFQGRKTKRTSAANALAARAERIIGLTGTPMWSKPDSMYALLQLITPGAWGTHFEFAKRYCNAKPTAHGWTYNGLSNSAEFSERLKHVMVRRTWRDVAPQLPPTVVVVEPVSVPSAALARVESLAMLACLAQGTNTVAGYLATLRRRLADLKLVAAIDAVEVAFSTGHPKVVLWSWHKEVADKLAKELEKRALKDCTVWRYRTGSDVDQIEGFTKAPAQAVIIASIAAGGVAIDLSASDYAIFAELDWIPAHVQQAAMRTFNPARPHVVVYLYADTMVETKLVAALGVKEDFQNALQLGFDAVAAQILTK